MDDDSNYWPTVLYVGAVILLATWLTGCHSQRRFSRVEYFNISDRAGTIDYAQATTGVRYSIGESVDVEAGLGEQYYSDDSSVRTFTILVASWSWGPFDFFTGVDVLEPWDEQREFTTYTALEVEY